MPTPSQRGYPPTRVRASQSSASARFDQPEKIYMTSAIRFFLTFATLAIFWTGPSTAVGQSTTTVGVYDETSAQTNNVDFNATGNAHTASTGNGATYSTFGTFNSLIG